MRYSIPASVKTSRLDAVATNRVLRNSYLLLSLTLLPTIAGAYAGALFPIMAALGWAGLAVFLAGMFGFQFMVMKNRTRPAGIVWLLGFTFFMGYFLGPMIGFALGSFSNGAQLVATAIGGTAGIFFGIAGYASVTKRDFSQWSFGKALMIGMWMAFIGMFINFFFYSSAVALALSTVFIVIMSGFILFTINRVVRGGEDNYIMVAMMLYISLFNIFQSLLHLLMAFAGNRE